MPNIFPAHEYDVELYRHLGPQEDWLRALDPALRKGPFSVIIHGVMGAGKSRLIEYLTAATPDTISGINESGAGGVSTESQQYRVWGDRNRYLAFIDTPGFGETGLQGQENVLEGIDQAIGYCRDSGAPLKRIYFMLDFARDSDILPDTIFDNLKVLRLAYGDENISRIRFIISKFDRLAEKFTIGQLREKRSQLTYRFSTRVESRLEQNAVLFISAGNANTPGCIRQLIEDLNGAAHEPEMNIAPRPLDPQSQFVKPLLDLFKVASRHAKEFNHQFEPLPQITSIRELRLAYFCVQLKVDELRQYLKSRQGILDTKVDKDIVKGVLGTAAMGIAFPPAGLAFAAFSTYKGAKHKFHMKQEKEALEEIDTLYAKLDDQLPSLCH